MFHMDADIGVQVCDLSYMKGHVAHAGFPEISYATMAEKLVSAGYKVARVEQTETPEQLQERKKRTSGPKPKVVNREVCSILTAGTRTCCYLDQHDAFDPDAFGASGSSSTGPLLAISEVLVDAATDAADADESSNADEVLPVCEYGVTMIDALRGSVTVGQFADDVLRSRMNTLLATYEPSEVRISYRIEPVEEPCVRA
jgi:DNA mismatch repair protein MSH6